MLPATFSPDAIRTAVALPPDPARWPALFASNRTHPAASELTRAEHPDCATAAFAFLARLLTDDSSS